MDYFSLLHLQKEPFSNSPDPEMFFQSTQHQGCLQKLEMAIHLKRGLSVVVGDIGTGKSTLCRQLIRVIARDNSQILPYLILDPEFTTPLEFLLTISKTFGLDCPELRPSEWQLKDAIKNHLFTQAAENQKILVLIIDEGQKLPGFCVELLREFLNFETNQFKLLQIVIFAQEEFTDTLKHKANFADRITTYQRLRPLSLQETRAMIDFRLDKAHTEPGPPPKLFTLPAVIAIFCLTRGYPRRIVMLCSKVIIAILISRDSRAGFFHVLRAAKETSSTRPHAAIQWGQVMAVALTIAVLSCAIVFATRPAPATLVKKIIPRPPVAATTPQPAAVASATPALEPQQKAAPPASTPPAPPELPPEPQPAARQPGILGTLEIEEGVILSKMIARVYGRYSPKKLALVLAANPQIATPNHISVHTPVHFPAIPPEETPQLQPSRVYLQLAETASLAEAYASIKDYPETAPPLLIIATPLGNGFRIIMEESFTDAPSALAKTPALPSQWRETVTARTGKEITP